MKKENIYKFLYVISLLLVIGFMIRLGADYFKYSNINNSTPFYAFVIERVIEFILPSMVVWIAAKVLKRKYSK